MSNNVISEPVCLIRQQDNELVISDTGLNVLRDIHQPIAVVCLAGQYRTGKSFFLNQLARNQPTDDDDDDRRRRRCPREDQEEGFVVGTTTESCTRGIWLWDTSLQSKDGSRIVLMDTEGMAALDNDESYDAKIFSLGLLLSSLFIFNSMGVIDESAIDRLYLVSELTKHICLQSTSSQTSSEPSVNRRDLDLEEDQVSEQALAPYFPPFIWLLRDFMLDIQVDGKTLSSREYLETALEIRHVAAGTTKNKRIDERNRIRTSLKTLFCDRQCFTLVRPVTDESQLRHAAKLPVSSLRREFLDQLSNIREHVLTSVRPKTLLGKILDGPKLVSLVQVYVETLNSGSIPDMKGAWEYVSEATCRKAEQHARETYDSQLREALVVSDSDSQLLLSLHEFDQVHKLAQDRAIQIFKQESVDGLARSASIQRLKSHIQQVKQEQVEMLQMKSKDWCTQVCSNVEHRTLQKLLNTEQGEILPTDFCAQFEAFDVQYEAESAGPAKKPILLEYLRGTFSQVIVPRIITCLQQGHASQLGQLQAKCKSEFDDMTRHVERVTEQLERSSAEVRNLEQVRNQLEQDLESRKDECQTLKEEISQVRDQFDSATREQMETQAQVRSETQARQSTELQLNTATVELKHTTRKVNDAMELIAEMKSEFDQKMQTYVRETQEETQRRDAREAQVQAQAQLIEEQLAMEQNTTQDLMQSHQDLSEQITTQSQALEKERRLRRTVESQNEECNETMTNLHLTLEHMLKVGKTQQQEQEQEKEALVREFQRTAEQREVDQQLAQDVRQTLEESIVSVIVTEAKVEGVCELAREERQVLQEQLGDLYLKISTLPDFYQRQVFCAEEKVPDFFDVLTQ